MDLRKYISFDFDKIHERRYRNSKPKSIIFYAIVVFHEPDVTDQKYVHKPGKRNKFWFKIIKWVKKDTTDKKKQLEILFRARTGIILNLVKTLGDTIVSLQGSMVYPLLTGSNIHEVLISLGGITSGAIATLQNYW